MNERKKKLLIVSIAKNISERIQIKDKQHSCHDF